MAGDQQQGRVGRRLCIVQSRARRWTGSRCWCGADVRILNNRGVSVFPLAVKKGMEDGLALFFEKGADPNR